MPLADARAVLLRLARSAGAGGVATLADLASLATMVSIIGLSPRVASVPALTIGSAVMFAGQRLAFRARGGNVRRELLLFAVVQLVGLGLNALLYDAALRFVPLATRWYVATRMATTNVVWLGFSFPAWHWVFPARDRTDASRSLSER
jgi:putative flippase GtrA